MINFARKLVEYQIVSIKPNEVKLESIKSPVYCDIKALQSDSELRNIVVSSLVEKIKNYEVMPEGIAGVISGIVPFSSLVADRLNLPHYSVGESQKKFYGIEEIIDGRVKSGENILLLDDLMITGKKSANAIKLLRSKGANVEKILCVINYDTNAANDTLKQIGCEIDYLTTIERIIFEHLATHQPAKKAMQQLKVFVKKYIPHGDKLTDFLSRFKF
jgi:orotate phosphoribosyltransferase